MKLKIRQCRIFLVNTNAELTGMKLKEFILDI